MKFKRFTAFFALLLSIIICFGGCVSEIHTSQVDISLPRPDKSNDPMLETVSDSSIPTIESGDISDVGNTSDTSDTSGDASEPDTNGKPVSSLDRDNLPEFDGSPFVAINGNVPVFSESELTTTSYESYAALDSLGRCGVTIASVGLDIMPTEPRGDIGSVKPSGWNNVKYDTSLVDGGYIYNRCHLLGFQLTGENANKRNLITGTRYMNIDGMLPFENMVADYVKETGNHVALRVTPIFVGNELVARGVQMEAYSVEDDGDGICYNVYCFNVQPGITINYSDGSSRLSGEAPDGSAPDTNGITYILNTSTKKFHYEGCHSADKIKEENREETSKSREELISEGYSPCGNCDP